MNTVSRVKVISCSLFFFILLQIPATSQNVTLKFDYSNFLLTYKILKEGDVTLSDSLLKLPATQKLINQAARFNNAANNITFKDELLTSLSGKGSQNNIFNLYKIKQNLDSLSELYDYIINNQEFIERHLYNKLFPYLHASDNLNTTIIFLIGGTSDGFAEGYYYCLDLVYFMEDIDAMKLLLEHEAFHILQANVYNKHDKNINQLQSYELGIYTLLKDLFNEGTASFIANPLNIQNPKPYTKWFQSKYKLNFRRIDENFELLQSMIIRLFYDKECNYNNVYNLGFSGKWESPLYYVGLRMCELIEKKEGQFILNEYLRKSPVEFIVAYQKYAKMEDNTKQYPVFTTECISIVRKLLK